MVPISRTGQRPCVTRSHRDRRAAVQSVVLALAACTLGQSASAQLVERKTAAAMAQVSPAAAAVAAAQAVPNPNCTLIVPPHPLTAQGLATPYQLFAPDAAQNGPCNEFNTAQSAFVQGAIIDTDTGQVSIYNPLVIDKGTKPAVAPVVPKLPKNHVVALWFGFNGTTLTLQGTNANTLANAKCVSGTPGSPFTQVSYCNAPNFFQAADMALAKGTLQVSALGTALDGQPCPTVRDFSVVDQDQSDNVTTKYLVTPAGQIAQLNAANVANLKGATTLFNPGDNILIAGSVDTALGCKPFMAPDLANNGTPTLAQPLNELQARVRQAAPVALVPGTDPMVLVNNALNQVKADLYRNGMDQPVAQDTFADDGARYCRELLRVAPARLFNPATQKLLMNAPSLVPTVATNLFSFLGMRFVAAYQMLNCETLTGFADPITAVMDGNGVFTNATLNATAYAQIQKHLQTLQAQDFAADSSARSMQPAVAGTATAMCGNGNTLPGAAANYSAFIVGTGNFQGSNSQMTGSLAAGGNITLASYAVASQVTGVPTAALNPANIVVGQALQANNGGVGNGQQGTIYFANGAPQLNGFTAGGGAVATAQYDFNAAQALYQSAATALGALTVNGKTQVCENCINFTGTNPTLNVFTVAGADIQNAREIAISAPANSAVVINVTGGAATFQNGAVMETGVTAANVLWNFPTATAITLSSMDPMGTILAPFSAVTGSNGALTGQLVAANYKGSTSFTDLQYACTLPVP